MAANTNSAGAQSLTAYKVISFDIFGTILDWEAGFYPFLQPIVRQLPADHPLAAPFPAQASAAEAAAGAIPAKHPLFVAFDRHEARLMAEVPGAGYETLLGWAMRDLATELGVGAPTEAETAAAGASQGSWPAFADTAEALARLRTRCKLVPLSNVSAAALRRVLEGPFRDVPFDAVYTAQDIGSYKPAMENFEYLLDGVRREFGAERHQLLHVAHGVSSDNLPAENMDIDHVWVERNSNNWGDISRDSQKRLRVVKDVNQLADEMDRAYGEQTNGA